MDLDLIIPVVERLENRKQERKRLNLMQRVIDDRTDENGWIVITIEKEPLMVAAKDLKKLVKKSQDALVDDADLTRLKQLVQ